MKSRRIPVRKFFRDPKSLGYGLSPNGEMISSLRRWKGRLNICVQVGPHGRAKPVTQETEHDIGEYFWKGNGCLIYTQGSHLYRLDLESSKVGDDITPVKNVSIALVADLEGVSEDEILIQLKEGERGIFDVYRLNVRS